MNDVLKQELCFDPHSPWRDSDANLEYLFSSYKYIYIYICCICFQQIQFRLQIRKEIKEELSHQNGIHNLFPSPDKN